jgi:hypothetical protein
MASIRQIEANRANSQASTGPRSAVGKSVSARNARRHGLSIPIWSDRKLSTDAEELANEIAGPEAGSDLAFLARSVAEAQIDLIRIRQSRQQLTDHAFTRNAESSKYVHPRSKIVLVETFPLLDTSETLIRMDRYERRALSRRNAAMKAFQDARQATR